MNIIPQTIKNIFTRNKQVREPDVKARSSDLSYKLGLPNLNGQNAYEYLQAYADNAWVYGCVSRKTQDIAALPLLLYRTQGKEKKAVESHPILDVLSYVNNQFTAYDFIEWLVGSMELAGNFYCGIVDRDRTGNPKELLPYIPSLITPIPSNDPSKLIEKYVYNVNNLKIDLPSEAVLQIKYYSSLKTGYIIGLSPLTAARIAYETDTEASIWNLNSIKNGASVDGALMTENPTFNSAASRKEAIESWNQKYSGNRGEKTALLWGGMKWQQIGLNQKDMEFLNQRKMTREEICAVYKVPPAVLGLFEYANYANAEQQEKFYWRNGILPCIRKIESGLNEKFIPMFGNSKGYELHFDISGVEVLRESLDNKIKNGRELFAMGVPYNQIAEKLDLPIKDIEGGDIGYLPFSLSPAGQAGEQATVDVAKNRKLLKSKLTENHKEVKWKAFIKIADKFEARMKPVLHKVFINQELECQANLNKFKSMKKKINPDDIIFNSDDENKKLQGKLKPLYEQIIRQQANQEIENFQFGISFDLTNPRVSEWIGKHGLNAAEGINRTTVDALRKTLIDGIDAGESIPELSVRIADVFNQAKDYRTERIARTETIAASNEGALESYRQTGLKMRKGWLSAMDERTRETHIAAGQEYDDAGAIGLDEAFYVGDGHGNAPGQIEGHPEESCNCRCSIYPVIEE